MRAGGCFFTYFLKLTLFNKNDIILTGVVGQPAPFQDLHKGREDRDRAKFCLR